MRRHPPAGFVASLIVIALLAFAASPVFGQAPPAGPAVMGLPLEQSAADVLPPSTVLFMEARDVAATRARFLDNFLCKVYGDPQVRAYFKPLDDKIRGAIQTGDTDMQTHAKISVREIETLLNGRVALAVTDFGFIPKPDASVVLLITPKDADLPKSIVARLMAVLSPDEQKRITTRRVQGIDVSEMPLEELDARPFSWAVAGNTLLVGVGRGATDDILNRMALRGPSLSTDPSYVAILGKLADVNQDWMYYVTFDRLLTMLKLTGGEDAMKFLAVSGIGDVRAMGAAAKVNGSAVDDKLYLLFAPQQVPGRLQSVLSPKPLNMDLLQATPPEADIVTLSRFNLPLLYTSSMDVLRDMSPRAFDKYQKQLAQVTLDLGVSIEDDVVKPLGDEASVYRVTGSVDDLRKRIDGIQNPVERRMAVALAGYENLAFVIKLADSAKMQKSLKVLADRALSELKGTGDVLEQDEILAIHFTDVVHNGITLRLLDGIPNSPIRPGYAVTPKYLIVAGSEKALTRAVDCALTPQTNAANSPVWEAARARIAEGAGVVTAADVRPSLELNVFVISQSMLPDLTPLILEDAPQNAALAEMLKKDPQPVIHEALVRNPLITYSTVKSDRDGVSVEARSMIGSGSLVVPATAALTAMLLPALSRAREQARRAACASNLDQLGKGIEMFRGEHGDAMPNTLQELIPKYLPDNRVLACPSVGPPPPGAQRVDYEYVGSLPVNVAGNTIIICDEPGNHRDGANCLFADYHEQWLSQQDLKQQLAASYANIKDWLAQQPPDVQTRVKKFYMIEEQPVPAQ